MISIKNQALAELLPIADYALLRIADRTVKFFVVNWSFDLERGILRLIDDW